MLKLSKLLLVCVALLAAAPAMALADPPATPTQAKGAPVVALIVTYGDGVEKHFTAIPWRDGLTVLDTLKLAQSHPRGIKIQIRGDGPTAMLTKIDDLENQGRGKNWIFRVNGKLGDVGIGAKQLKSGDSVLWKFEEYR